MKYCYYSWLLRVTIVSIYFIRSTSSRKKESKNTSRSHWSQSLIIKLMIAGRSYAHINVYWNHKSVRSLWFFIIFLPLRFLVETFVFVAWYCRLLFWNKCYFCKSCEMNVRGLCCQRCKTKLLINTSISLLRTVLTIRNNSLHTKWKIKLKCYDHRQRYFLTILT